MCSFAINNQGRAGQGRPTQGSRKSVRLVTASVVDQSSSSRHSHLCRIVSLDFESRPMLTNVDGTKARVPHSHSRLTIDAD